MRAKDELGIAGGRERAERERKRDELRRKEIGRLRLERKARELPLKVNGSAGGRYTRSAFGSSIGEYGRTENGRLLSRGKRESAGGRKLEERERKGERK